MRYLVALALLSLGCSDPECPTGTLTGPGICKVPEAGKGGSVAPRAGAPSWPKFEEGGKSGQLATVDADIERGGGKPAAPSGTDAGRRPESDAGKGDARCGNGKVEAGETCDGDCPADCDDGNPCTDDVLLGTADECNAVCDHDAVAESTECGDGRLCTATGQCVAKGCGNGVLEEGELCDGDCPESCDDVAADCREFELAGWACQRHCKPRPATNGTLCNGGRGACDVRGGCVADVWYRGCVNDDHCFGVLRCQPDRLICSAECETDADCGASGVCHDGWCDAPCGSSTTCRNGQVCTSGGGGVYCRPQTCSPESTSSRLMCARDFVCSEVTDRGHVCVALVVE